MCLGMIGNLTRCLYGNKHKDSFEEEILYLASLYIYKKNTRFTKSPSRFFFRVYGEPVPDYLGCCLMYRVSVFYNRNTAGKKRPIDIKALQYFTMYQCTVICLPCISFVKNGKLFFPIQSAAIKFGIVTA